MPEAELFGEGFFRLGSKVLFSALAIAKAKSGLTPYSFALTTINSGMLNSVVTRVSGNTSGAVYVMTEGVEQIANAPKVHIVMNGFKIIALARRFYIILLSSSN